MRHDTRLELDTITIRAPMRFERRGGRKLIIAPDGSPAAAAEPMRFSVAVAAGASWHPMTAA